MKRVCYLCMFSVALMDGTSDVFASEVEERMSITDGASIQSALDSRPGQIIYLPPGDYEISEPIVISHDNSGLVGSGRIIQTNPDVAIIMVSDAAGVELRDVTLTRPPGTDGAYSGLVANSCRNLVIDNVRVLDNRAASSSINLSRCSNGRLCNCLVRNYSRISIDDRTKSDLYGFAFKCIDGTGIQLTGCQGMLVQGNRVEELLNLPTREIKEEFGLGKFTTKNRTKGSFVGQETWDIEEFPQWHQGSAIHIGEPEVSDQIQLVGNYIENAAQGIDVHADHVIVGQNIVNNAAVGVKAMHGSRNILIVGNQFNKCDCHAILLQPGARSHAADDAADGGDSAKTPANIDGASIIASNIISDFGYGNANWIWGNDRDVICLEPGQTPKNPPLTDVIVQGNVVYDPGRDRIMVDGKPTQVPPRYRYALLISGSSEQPVKGPVNVQVFNNVLHPGTGGISNVPLTQPTGISP